jgi:hypothetical protein
VFGKKRRKAYIDENDFDENDPFDDSENDFDTGDDDANDNMADSFDDDVPVKSSKGRRKSGRRKADPES